MQEARQVAIADCNKFRQKLDVKLMQIDQILTELNADLDELEADKNKLDKNLMEVDQILSQLHALRRELVQERKDCYNKQ